MFADNQNGLQQIFQTMQNLHLFGKFATGYMYIAKTIYCNGLGFLTINCDPLYKVTENNTMYYVLAVITCKYWPPSCYNQAYWQMQVYRAMLTFHEFKARILWYV